MTEILRGDSRRAILELLTEAPALFCFLDYDGTLAEIAPRPEMARPVRGAREVVSSLARLPGVYIAIVSGRRAEELRDLVAAEGVFYIGVHGGETIAPQGQRCLAVDLAAIKPAARYVRELLRSVVQSLKGVWIEDKELAFACHTRLASPDVRKRAEETLMRVYEQVKQSNAPFELLRGHCVFEFRPVGVNKGSAILKTWRKTAPEALPMYAGDDVTDEDAFQALLDQGLTIRVGCDSAGSAARYCVETPTELVGFLKELWEARRGKLGLPKTSC